MRDATAILHPMLGLVIPVKMLDSAKMRLSSALGPEARRRLSLAMLEDVLRGTEWFDPRVVVTKDPDAEAVAIANGCLICPDPGSGLNDAVDHATAMAADLGVVSLLVLPSDVPMATRIDIDALLGASKSVAIARSADGGTNGLFRAPLDVIDASFGPHSAEAHARSARVKGIEAVILDLPSLAIDVDDLDALAVLAARSPGTQSGRFAASILSDPDLAAEVP